MAKKAELRVNHGPIDEDVIDNLTDAEKDWLRSWNRGDEIPGESDEDDDTEDENEDGDYTGMGVEELKDELRNRDLPVSGNKDDLIARLVEDDESDE